ncbi:MAG: hypothetical protein ACHQ9S_24080 [Candidatus Binatia bacterium]
MRSVIVVMVLIGTCGCTATRYSPPLDRELTVDGGQFLQLRSVVNATAGSGNDHCDGLPISNVERSTGSVTVHENRLLTFPGRGFQCFEPMLYVLTLGIIPSDCTHDYSFEATIDGREPPERLGYSVTTIQGWIAGPLSLFPGWEFSVVPPRQHCLRAFRTAINGAAKSQDHW